MEVFRIVEHQASLSSYRATQNEDRAVQLELLIESTKPKNHYLDWHPLISTPFRYSPPLPAARFRPPYGKNVFYSSFIEETALFEHAFHFMRERRHLNMGTETGVRTIFTANVEHQNSIHINSQQNSQDIMHKNDYSASHQFVIDHPETEMIIYPSCRDPKQRENAAILDIQCIGKNPAWEAAIKFFYDNPGQQITWLDYQLPITWNQIC